MPKPEFPRTFLQTCCVEPGSDELNGPLEPPPTGEGWQGGPWELVNVSYGPPRSQYVGDTAVWVTIAWRRR